MLNLNLQYANMIVKMNNNINETLIHIDCGDLVGAKLFAKESYSIAKEVQNYCYQVLNNTTKRYESSVIICAFINSVDLFRAKQTRSTLNNLLVASSNLYQEWNKQTA